MPPSVSVKSQELLDQRARIEPAALSRAENPVWVNTRQVKGFFEAAKLRELCSEREDLSYITKTLRNADKGAIPGFSFLRTGEESLNDYFKRSLPPRDSARLQAPDARPDDDDG
jgi:hypothetical protein